MIKHQFGLMKMRFRGLAKNTARLITLFALCEYVDGATQATGNDIRIASLDCEMSRNFRGAMISLARKLANCSTLTARTT